MLRPCIFGKRGTSTMPALESLDSFSRLPANILCDQRCIERSGGHLRRPPDARAEELVSSSVLPRWAHSLSADVDGQPSKQGTERTRSVMTSFWEGCSTRLMSSVVVHSCRWPSCSASTTTALRTLATYPKTHHHPRTTTSTIAVETCTEPRSIATAAEYTT